LLVADVLAFDCNPIPFSPCINCPDNTTLLVADTVTVDLTLVASTLTADVNVSADAGNTIEVHADGLFVPVGMGLSDCAGTPLDDTSQVITLQGVQSNATTTDPTGIWSSADLGEGILDCPAVLTAPPCSAQLNRLDVVLGGDGVNPSVQWGLPARTSLRQLIRATTSGAAIDPQTVDLVVYTNAGAGSIAISDPTDVDCGTTDLYIKNLSVSTLTVTSTSFDGGIGVISLDGQILAGYPFGNDGGESVHIAWVPSLSTWVIL